MGGDERKAIAWAFLEAVDRGDQAAVRAMLAEDFLWESVEAATVRIDGRAMPHTLDRDAFVTVAVPAVAAITRDGLHFSEEFSIGEGSRLAIFGRSNAATRDGRPYANIYCWYFEFAGDRISRHREYRDTHMSRAMLFD